MCPESEDGAEPLTEPDAEAQVHGICFKTGPPGRLGVELEWLVCDGRDPALPVDQRRAATAVARLVRCPHTFAGLPVGISGGPPLVSTP